VARTASQRLRTGLVADLRARGAIRSEAVEAAFLAVARERFIPHLLAERGTEAVYRDDAIVTKRDPRGMPLSSSSQPALMAKMLELLDPQPGHRVLEVGAGTGYNAALLAHIVGPRGRVTSIDVDPEVARTARRALRNAGYRVSVQVGDGRQGHPEAAPYDRIIVTACADEISSAWLEQLADGGRLELPLRLDPDGAAIQLIPVLERHGRRLQSVGLTWGGFMPLHDGDGGWRPPPAALSASRTAKGRHTALAAISGAGLQRLSAAAARGLLASVLTASHPPLRQGMTGLTGSQPPMLLLYLLLNIPAARRVSLSHDGRLGIGIIDPPSQSLAVVSVPSPWRSGAHEPEVRARWRLDAYGNDGAAIELEQLLAQWRELQRTGATTLRVTAHGRGRALRVTFAWGS
jgi:protein-L-isoaspartate(D-aspartate) O-methyltransferase